MAALSLDEARKLLLGHFEPTGTVEVALLDSMGRFAAEDLRSDRDFPPFDRVAMDGYAIHAADSVGASAQRPSRLRVLGSARAGSPFRGAVGAGECTKAMTGAALPEGADAVVEVEKTNGYSEDLAEILCEAASGRNIAARGEDLSKGERLVSAGTRLGEQHLQALASAGHAWVTVHAAPRAAVLATGDELVAPHELPGAGQIRESNGSTIVGILRRHGIAATKLPVCRDELGSLTQACASALDAHDLLVLSGGVSKGEHDHVKTALRAIGVRLHFESLALRPGHPTTFGSRDDKAVFALPGNPVAVVATLSVVFAPALRRWMGERGEPSRHFAELLFAYERRGDREQLLPVALLADAATGRRQARAVAHHGSGDFVSLARADGFLRLPAGRSRFEPGEILEIFPFRELF
jgi:molybdopterin molybdotransferase